MISHGDMKLINDFPSSYVVDVDPGWPMRGEEEISLLAYHKLHMHTGEFCNIRFYVEKGASWIGRFELGERGGDFENSILTAPSPDQACVISSGAGYWVDVKGKQVTQIECLPITQAVATTKHSSIIIATWRDLYAYSSANASWSLRDLADDRLRIDRIDQDILTAVGFTMGEMTEMHIDLLTGQVI